MLVPRSQRRIIRPLIVVLVLTVVFSGYLRDAVSRVFGWAPTEGRVNEGFPPAFGQEERPVEPAQPQPERKKAETLGKHHYRRDGLLEVNEDGPDPVYKLIARAEKAWDKKRKRASKTLEEAVIEYQRRYHRDPPRGFDLWWKYAKANGVQLPDEYDQIYHDLEPFWGLEPADLLETRSNLEKKVDSYTIGKTLTTNVSVVTYAFEEGRYDQLIKGSEQIVDLIQEIQDFLPPFRATFSPHDGPNRLSDYAVKSAALEAASVRTYIDRIGLPRINAIGWASACSPSSPARRAPIDLDNPPQRPAKKTFIHDHLTTMDPCLHPDHFHHHGQFLSHDMGPTPQDTMVPEFSYCSSVIHHDIRLPTPYSWVEDIYPRSDDPEWDDKVDERLLWRGRNTGMFHSSTTRWQNSHRDFLVRYTNELDGTMEVLVPNRTRSQKLEAREVRKARINPAVMDIAFAGDPIACSPTVCPQLEKLFPWREYQTTKEAGNYKYIIDVDGNGWSGRFKRLMTTNSLIFKSTIYPEWYMDRVQPWVHYVPIQLDLSDLHDALIFFRGDGNGDGAHEDLARKIAVAGRNWSKAFWRREDMVSYFFRLILEYARLMNLDRASMTYSGHSYYEDDE